MSSLLRDVKVNEAPPIARRPRCPACNKALRPLWDTVKTERVPYANGGFWYRTYLKWNGQYHGYGAFDTMRCGVEYANAIITARKK